MTERGGGPPPSYTNSRTGGTSNTTKTSAALRPQNFSLADQGFQNHHDQQLHERKLSKFEESNA